MVAFEDPMFLDTGVQDAQAYNRRIEALRKEEYPMLKDQIYLDHAGITLPARSLMTTFATEMSSMLIGNPHSLSSSSQLSTSRIENIRLRVLRMLNADPAQFDVVFVANATAGIKLVTEAFRAIPDGFDYAYHQSSHTSLIGVRQEARDSICLDDAATDDWINNVNPSRPTLFAYPAQSNLDGRRFLLQWCKTLRKAKGTGNDTLYSLLDAAAYVSTAPLDLSDSSSAPDFTVFSFYKIFGFPDLGALIVRRESAPILTNRRYFGGGTVDSVICGPDQWHARKNQSIHEALEDGTLPIHSIIALDAAIDTHLRLFGTMHDVSRHTSYLAKRLRYRLQALRHASGSHVCVLYNNESNPDLGSGAVVAFNMQDENGVWVSLAEFQKLASLKGFHLRTGGICNPGGISAALDLAPWEVKKNYAQGFRCGGENDVIRGKPTGVIRLSLGAMSTESDVDIFVDFIREFYSSKHLAISQIGETQSTVNGFYIEDLIIYPIKSCRGFHIPKHMDWQLRPEGLLWDREWCLVHAATGRALSQKRYPRMALLQPTIDTQKRTLNITFVGEMPVDAPVSISIPLAYSLDSFERSFSRVCDDEISLQRYISPQINEFFSKALDVPCILARMSPDHGERLRSGKVHPSLSQNKQSQQEYMMPGSFPSLACVPGQGEQDYKILLSNESPVLAVTSSSIRQLNKTIEANGGRPVSAEVFRANIIIGSPKVTPAYSEDRWSRLSIGQLDFKVLGPCQRCHMVCIDPDTGVKGAEPFVTLSKTRRFNGKVMFGVHLNMMAHGDDATQAPSSRVLKVGSDILEEVS